MRIIPVFICLCFSINIFGQTQKIKKKTEISFNYNYTTYPASISIDTIVTRYDTNGATLYPKGDGTFSEGVIIYEGNPIIIDSTKNHVHGRYSYSDGQSEEFYKNYFKDSIVTFIIQGDTNTKEIQYLKGKKIVRTISYDKSKDQSYKLYSDFSINKDNFIVKKTTEIEPDGRTERVTYNKLTKKTKKYSFNDTIKKWYVSRKEKYNSKRFKKTVTQFYHDYFKRYFKTYTKYYYNSLGYVELIITKDNYRTLEEKKVYLYEYY